MGDLVYKNLTFIHINIPLKILPNAAQAKTEKQKELCEYFLSIFCQTEKLKNMF